MGDHFVLLVDRLLTESTLDATIGSMNPSYNAEDSSSTSETTTVKDSSPTRRSVDGSSVGQLVQCRICHDDDDDSNMEAPCSCCGSLKYAHRKCVQRWCNEKGDTVCEICLQQFKPGYTAPTQLFHIGGVPMNFRGNNWEISRRHDLDNPGLLFARDRSNSDSSYNYYSSSTATSVFYCRSVAVIFMVLLVLRHTLPIIISGEENYSFAIFAILLLRIFGILVPIYVMARALSLFHCSRQRRQQETRELQVATSDDEHVIPPPPQQLQPPPHLIHIQ